MGRGPWGHPWGGGTGAECQKEPRGAELCLETGDAARRRRRSLALAARPRAGCRVPHRPAAAAMGSGRVPAAGAVLVALLALGARPAAGTRPSGELGAAARGRRCVPPEETPGALLAVRSARGCGGMGGGGGGGAGGGRGAGEGAGGLAGSGCLP